MQFYSCAFAVFLTIVFCGYWLVPAKYRWLCIVLTSFLFYMSFDITFGFWLIFTTAISYVAAIQLEQTRSKNRKKIILYGTICVLLALLFYFKYFNFFSRTIISVLNLFTISLNPVTVQVLLPVGISFYIFQALGYVIDVYRGQIKAERHFGYFASFMTFFPKLFAGPIERTNNLLPQIKREQEFDYQQANTGLKLMAWGFFKKVVIADSLSKYVQMVFVTPQYYQGFALVLASFFYSIQIYCDFSGYSDIAIGTAKLFGINLTANFATPYFSSSIKEFWNRWHISLSTWFRDYLYIPLGGSRCSTARCNINIMITFLVSGLWHGANCTFVLWGGIHGLAQILEKHFWDKNVYCQACGRFGWMVHVVLVFCFCNFAWVLFASHSIADASWFFSHMFDGISKPFVYFHNGFEAMGLVSGSLKYILLDLFVLFLYDFLSLKTDVITLVSKQTFLMRWTLYLLLVLAVFYANAGGEDVQFIYFRF